MRMVVKMCTNQRSGGFTPQMQRDVTNKQHHNNDVNGREALIFVTACRRHYDLSA